MFSATASNADIYVGGCITDSVSTTKAPAVPFEKTRTLYKPVISCVLEKVLLLFPLVVYFVDIFSNQYTSSLAS
jgi:hypothetical protein